MFLHLRLINTVQIPTMFDENNRLTLVKNRKPTNTLALICYCIAWFILIFIAIWFFVNGDITYLTRGVDDMGNRCEVDEPYLFPMNFLDPSKSLWICVTQCPNETIRTRSELYQLGKEKNVKLCNYSVPLEDYMNEELYPKGTKGPCPVMPVYSSIPILGRCVLDPTSLSSFEFNTSKYYFILHNLEDKFKTSCGDLKMSLSSIVLVLLCTKLMYIIFIWIIPFITAVVIRILLVLLVISSGVGSIICWILYWNQGDELSEFQKQTMEILNSLKSYFFFQGENYLTAILLTILTIVLLLITPWIWKHLYFVTEVFRNSRSAICWMPCMILLPIFTAFTILAVALFISISALFGLTMAYGEMKAPRLLNLFMHKINIIGIDIPTGVLVLYHILMLIWTWEFLIDFQQLSISIAVAEWFFKSKQSNRMTRVFHAVGLTLRYHLGTVILGSLVISLMRVFRAVFSILEAKMLALKKKRATGASGCLKCIQSILRFCNSAAYTVTAVNGTAFCESSSRASALIGGHLVKFTLVRTLCSLFLFIGKLVVSTLSAIMLSSLLKNNLEINRSIVPIIVVFLLAYIYGRMFFSIYDSVVNSMAIIYCIVQTECREDRRSYFTDDQIEFFEKMKDDPVPSQIPHHDEEANENL
ncbi:CTL-like protein 1 [Trichinella nelsoni]|uniref:Choline transporter-like protein n=1 Tax=Trichinella nelsoni TaxID=6336 RepID=A0A0V0RT33_9BILA|nr:CTL-like protein 1 [Trichinella nelsoni]